jgi:DNA polymerase-3 subunit gamma/tau
LDQAIAFGGGQVETAAVSAMLGSIDRRQVTGLLEKLAANDAPGLLEQIAALDEYAPDYAAVLADVLSLLQRVALAQVAPDAPLDDEVADPEEVRRLADLLSPEDVQLFYQIALLGRRDLPLSPDPRGGFEMALLRMLCFRPATLEVAASPSASPPGPTATVRPAAPGPTTPVVAAATLRSAPPPSPPSQPVSEWSALVAQLSISGIAKQVAMNCELIERKGQHFLLALEPSHAQMLTKSAEERLKASLEEHLGEPVSLKFQTSQATATTPALQRSQQQAERRQAAMEQTQQDPYVRDMQEMFDARITAIHPLDESDG